MGYSCGMTMREKKYAIAGLIVAAMVFGHILERYAGWDGAFMTIAGIAVALAGAWLVSVILEQRRRTPPGRK